MCADGTGDIYKHEHQCSGISEKTSADRRSDRSKQEAIYNIRWLQKN